MLNCYTEGENILEQIINIDRIENAVALFGSFDENIKIIENEYAVTVVVRDEHLKVSGDVEDVAKATKVIENLLLLLNRGETISEQNVRYCISLINEGSEEKLNIWQAIVFVLLPRESLLSLKPWDRKILQCN